MAVLWMTEAVPIPATSLLPLILFPLAGVSSFQDAAVPYASPIVFLFFGGLMLSIGMRRWGLHRRLALAVASRSGDRPAALLGGFMLATAMISMWVNNTATTLLMLPLATSLVGLLGRDGEAPSGFAPALMLGVAYSASIGGMGTLIGTAPNALLVGFLRESYGIEIGFFQWMAFFGLPVVAIGLPLCWFILSRVAFRLGSAPIPGAEEALASERAGLGPMGLGERVVAVVFALMAAGWLFQPLIGNHLPMFTDSAVAIAGAFVLLVFPVDWKRGKFLLDWGSTKDMPWDVLLLFGSGLSLALMMTKSGLTAWVADVSGGLGGFPVFMVVLLAAAVILLLTELTSNTATTAAFLPVAAALAVGAGVSPVVFAVPVALAASCAFMLPVATPPNAVVFASGQVTLPQMAKAGVWLNLSFLAWMPALVYVLGRFAFAG